MSVRGKIFLLVIVLAVLTAAALLRVTLYSDAASKYSNESNKQLQSRALELVKKITELVDAFNKKDREAMIDYDKNYLATRTTERQSIRDRYENRLKEANDLALSDYKKRLMSEVKTVREALHGKLPKRLQRPQLSKLYDNPSKVLEMQTIADDLELLAKSLPDT